VCDCLVNDTIFFIKKELSTLYEKYEVESFVSLLLEHFAGIDTAHRLMADSMAIDAAQAESIADAVRRLKAYEPIQYILGTVHFYGLTLQVDRRALIPRRETEELVETIIGMCRGASDVLDVGCGSGCIAVSLAKNLPDANVTAIDVSGEAIELAKTNAETNGVNINFYRTNILEEWTDSKTYDLIVSNPPYVTHKEKSDMKPNVLDYEPHGAIFVDDDDPLLYYRAVSEFARTHLDVGGSLFFEINRAYGNDIARLLMEMGFGEVEIMKDIAGNDRFIKCRRQNDINSK